MYIKNDYSHIRTNDEVLIKNGYGKMTVHSIHFTWNKCCDGYVESFSVPLADVLQEFVTKYDIHQVSEETSTMEHYNSNWDLFFWSDKGWNKKDFMTHFSLTFNTNRTPEQNMKLLEKIISLVELMNYENVVCHIQYEAFIDKKKVEEKANAIYKNFVGKFIKYCGMTGKIKVIQEENGIKKYGFFKKNARNKYYPITNMEILTMGMQSHIYTTNNRRS